jgi:hypothetical protein
MFLVGSNWLVGGPTEFMERKLATGGVFIVLFWLHYVINCTKITFTYIQV